MTAAPAVLSPPKSAYSRLNDYGAIGSGRSVALVSRAGSIDWWCPGRFDAPSVFGGILDASRGGTFRITPTDEQATDHFRYVPDTNVLETTHTSDSGEARVTDFAPFEEDLGLAEDVLVRRIEGIRGSIELEVTFSPRFQYGAVQARFTQLPGQATLARGAGELLLLTGLDLAPSASGSMRARVHVQAGERVDLVLRHSPYESPVPFAHALPSSPAELETMTLARWRAWSAKTSIEGPDADLVRRSALALKMLQCSRNGAIIAAPTTSLPEEIGGVRNWDYRYAWVRDGALCAQALGDAGHEEEADLFARWLDRAIGTGPEDMRVLYSVGAQRELPERVLSHLEGHRKSVPVRIGNEAATQHQLDVYGELFHFVAQRGAPRPAVWPAYARLADWVADHWREPDSGIWEVRCEPKHFVLSKAMAALALERASDMARQHGLAGDVERWEREAGAARHMVLTEGYDAEAGYFTQAIGERHIDASNLLLSLVGFIDPQDPRMLGTVDRILVRLLSNGLVYRYIGADDGLPGGEATFSYCTFWLVEALALQGRVRDARALFDRIAERATTLGLYAEEMEATTGEHLGNFPQGFPHAGLIQAALALHKAERRQFSA